MARHKRYGHKRIALELKMNKKRIRRGMRLFGLKPQRQRRQPGKPQDQYQAPMTIPNLLKEIVIDAPNIAWVNDFTYLPYFADSSTLPPLRTFLPEKSLDGKFQPNR